MSLILPDQNELVLTESRTMRAQTADGLQLFRVDPDADAGTIQYPETGQSLRWVRVDDTVWLHFADLCKGTGHSNPRSAINLIEDEDKRKLDMRKVFAGQAAVRNFTAGPTSGNAEAWFVNEDGFTTLGLAGRGDGPRMFRRWIVKVVLPQFRQQQLASRPKTGAEVVLAMAQQLVDQEQRLVMVEQAQAATAARIAAIEGSHDWFTALGYAKLHGHDTERSYLARVGKKATALMKADGAEPHPRQDATFGQVNTYPVPVLERAFEAVAR